MPPRKKKEPETPAPKAAAKPRGRRTSKNKIQPELELVVDDSDSKLGIGGDPEKTPDVDWDDTNLNLALLMAIIEDRNIKNGLFPPPGSNASTQNGGGVKKTEWDWQLAQKLFTRHPKYEEAFSHAIEANKLSNRKSKQGKTIANKYRSGWADKIKNRLARMRTITVGHIKSMGLTGAWIRTKAELLGSGDEELINKWLEIKDEVPWFSDMRSLIGERPNAVHAGLGHSGTDVDMGVFGTASLPEELSIESQLSINEVDVEELKEDPDEKAEDDEELGAIEVPVADPTGDEEDDEDVPAVSSITQTSKKRKADHDLSSEMKDSTAGTASKTPARAGSSKPTTAPSTATAKSSQNHKKAKFSGIKDFVSVSQAEEATCQKELELAKAKIDAAARIKVAQEQAKVSREQAKAKLEQMRLENKLKLQQMQMETSRIKFERRMQLAELKYWHAEPYPTPGPSATAQQPAALTYNSHFMEEMASSSPSPYVEGSSSMLGGSSPASFDFS